MAILKSNIIFKGITGKLGNLIFFQRNGQTVVRNAPGKKNTKATVAQQANNEKFKAAAQYAKNIRFDSKVWKKYEAMALASPGKSAYNVAIADFFNVPEVMKIDTSTYLGQPGQKIVIQMNPADLLEQVKVTITSADGTILEKGSTVVSNKEGKYSYKIKEWNHTIPGTIIQVYAVDYPGNKATHQVTLT